MKPTIDKEELDNLKELIHKDDKICTILRRVSARGMSRVISVLVIADYHEIICVDYYISKLLGIPLRQTDQGRGLVVSGCGMDMGFDLVYQISYALFGDGYSLSQTWL